jgi:hypothetical protein
LFFFEGGDKPFGDIVEEDKSDDVLTDLRVEVEEQEEGIGNSFGAKDVE